MALDVAALPGRRDWTATARLRLICISRHRYIARDLTNVREALTIGEPVRRFGGFARHQELVCPALNLAVRDARALVLAQVLDPGFVHEGFKEARGLRRVVK